MMRDDGGIETLDEIVVLARRRLADGVTSASHEFLARAATVDDSGSRSTSRCGD